MQWVNANILYGEQYNIGQEQRQNEKFYVKLRILRLGFYHCQYRRLIRTNSLTRFVARYTLLTSLNLPLTFMKYHALNYPPSQHFVL